MSFLDGKSLEPQDVIHASADGQKFEARRETFKTRYSSKYFGTQKGVSAMTLIA
ncbi:Tn3 family transposase, partial [Klebsiella pneumoniae]